MSLLSTWARAQKMTVSGKVTEEGSNSGLPGVNIVIKGTSQGTVTDFDGNYSLSVDGDTTTLVFTYVGYIRREIPVNNRATLNVKLASDAKMLEETVVIGYGTQQKSE
ncbi:MAG: carboxypeptidase-like regulatory domain-containing protein, partial [Catalinimonas sp.]